MKLSDIVAHPSNATVDNGRKLHGQQSAGQKHFCKPSVLQQENKVPFQRDHSVNLSVSYELELYTVQEK